MAEGFEVAADDLRRFGKKMGVEGKNMSGVAPKVDGAALEFTEPIVGLGFKATYSATQEAVKDAISAIGSAYTTAGTKLEQVAEDYENRERAAKKAMTPQP